MYAGEATIVTLPAVGRVHILKNGYVYWENDGKWDPVKKRTIDSRVSIGKLVPDTRDQLYPNKKYFELFDKNGQRRPVQALSDEKENEAHQTYVDATDARKIAAEEPGKLSGILSFGVYYALNAAAEKVGCLSALKEAFPRHWDRILALSIHCIDAENAVSQDYEYWAFDNYSGLGKSLSSSEISSLYKEIGDNSDAIKKFIEAFHQNYLKNYPEATEHVLAFDSINQNTNSRNIAPAEFGEAKVKENLPDINTALFVDQDTGIPLYYEHFLGSLLDKVQSPVTIERAKDLGFNKLFLMMDKGYCTQKVTEALREQRFAIMCADNLCFVKKLIAEYSAEIKDQEKYYIAQENVYGVQVKAVPAFGDTYNAYVYYDAERAQDERNTIHLKVQMLLDRVNGRKRYSEKLKNQYSPWLIIQKLDRTDPSTGKNFIVTVRQDVIQEYIDASGYFVILSNTDKSAAEMISIARMRDRDEKAFRRIKYHFGLTKTDAYSLVTYEGKMFVAFVSLIICEAYWWYVKEQLHAITSTTTATSLGELRKYKILLTQDRYHWIPAYAATKKQKALLKDLGCTAAAMEFAARNVSLRV